MSAYFIFKGINSSDYLIVNKLPPIVKPTKDIEKIEVQGRDGFLTQDNGTYRGILKPTECAIRDLSNIDFICSWLSGSGDVIFSNEPDKKYKATIINQIDFNKILWDFHDFIIQFECQPHKYALTNSIITLTTSGTVNNTGTKNSKPVLKLYATGTVDLTINSSVIHLTNISSYVIIDSDLLDCYKDTLSMNNNMVGEFPELVPGNNTISWTGSVTKLEITPNWRW